MRDEDDERDVARPNDKVRAALLEALDYADRAGVALSYACGTAFRTRGGGHVVLQGGSGTDGDMSRTDALRIALRVGGEQEFDPASGDRRLSRLEVMTRSGVRLVLLCEPSRAQLEALTVEAVLQS